MSIDFGDSVFASERAKVWPHEYEVDLQVDRIHGGMPLDPRVVEKWIISKVEGKDRQAQAIRETMVALGYSPEDWLDPDKKEEIVAAAAADFGTNGFKRDEDTGELYIEGRHIKAMLKEAANIRYPFVKGGAKLPGVQSKSTKNWLAEHVFVPNQRIGLGVKEPDYVDVRFTTTGFMQGGQRVITREEVVENVTISFTILTDANWSFEDWGSLFLTGELQGLGASRSVGFGTFIVVRFEKIK